MAAAAVVEACGLYALFPVQMAPGPALFLGCRRNQHGTWPVSQSLESCVWNCGCESLVDLYSQQDHINKSVIFKIVGFTQYWSMNNIT